MTAKEFWTAIHIAAVMLGASSSEAYRVAEAATAEFKERWA